MRKNKNEKIKKARKVPTKLPTKSDKINRQIQRGFDIAKKWTNIDGQK